MFKPPGKAYDKWYTNHMNVERIAKTLYDNYMIALVFVFSSVHGNLMQSKTNRTSLPGQGKKSSYKKSPKCMQSSCEKQSSVVSFSFSNFFLRLLSSFQRQLASLHAALWVLWFFMHGQSTYVIIRRTGRTRAKVLSTRTIMSS